MASVINDWTARDLPGPKSKDFATSVGPVLVTADEFAGDAGPLVARVNGEERARADLSELATPWAELAAHAAHNTVLRPGDLLVTGPAPEPRPPLARGFG